MLFDLYLRHYHFRAALGLLGQDSEPLRRVEQMLRFVEVHPEGFAHLAADKGLHDEILRLARQSGPEFCHALEALKSALETLEPENPLPLTASGRGRALGFVSLGSDSPCGLAVPWVAREDKGAEERPIPHSADAVQARWLAKEAMLRLLQARFPRDEYLFERLFKARCEPELRGFGERLLCGDSLGLACFAAMFSHVFSVSANREMALAGALLPFDPSFVGEGRFAVLGGTLLGDVGMEGKIEALLGDAPWVRDLLLPSVTARRVRQDAVFGPILQRAGVRVHPFTDLLSLVESPFLFDREQLDQRFASEVWPALRKSRQMELSTRPPPAMGASSPIALVGPRESGADAALEALADGLPAAYLIQAQELLPHLDPSRPVDSLLSFVKKKLPSGSFSLLSAELEQRLAEGSFGLFVRRVPAIDMVSTRKLLWKALEGLTLRFPACTVAVSAIPGLAPTSWSTIDHSPRSEELNGEARRFLGYLARRFSDLDGSYEMLWRAAEQVALATLKEPDGVPPKRLLRQVSAAVGRAAAEGAVRALQDWEILHRRDDRIAVATRLYFASSVHEASLVARSLSQSIDPMKALRSLADGIGEDASAVLRSVADLLHLTKADERAEPFSPLPHASYRHADPDHA